ncbi:EbsA family protein [Salinibacter ruber]|uniref:EbsA family protein n=1 Tax=Salinibacter ruber TaxID=146919 RepID=UPI00207493E7|nr:EbsA family protein [Salinibacter ruber]
MSDVNGKLAEGSEIATDAVVLGLLAYALFAVFQRSVVVGTEKIRKVRPLWWDRSVQISEIRRVHVPTTQSGLWLYTDPDGKPALKIGAGLEDPVGLEELVIQSVLQEAEITGHRQKKH